MPFRWAWRHLDHGAMDLYITYIWREHLLYMVYSIVLVLDYITILYYILDYCIYL